MGFVPEGTRWYIAELIEEIRVEDDDRNVVHKNLVLLSAASPDIAYSRALEMGRMAGAEFTNPEGKIVTSRFRGLGYLDVVHDALEDGAELLYASKTSVEEAEILKWVLEKDELGAFQLPRVNSDGPDFSSKEVVDEAVKLIQAS